MTVTHYKMSNSATEEYRQEFLRKFVYSRVHPTNQKNQIVQRRVTFLLINPMLSSSLPMEIVMLILKFLRIVDTLPIIRRPVPFLREKTKAFI